MACRCPFARLGEGFFRNDADLCSSRMLQEWLLPERLTVETNEELHQRTEISTEIRICDEERSRVLQIVTAIASENGFTRSRTLPQAAVSR